MSEMKMDRLSRAVIMAAERHAGQLRKGTERPYIVHPLEVLSILLAMGADEDLLIAGVLHDTIEDTDTTAGEIERLFGSDVAELVAGHSEDKSLSWEERKARSVAELRQADERMKMMVMADKVSNLRSMYRDYHSGAGERLWERFAVGKEKISRYYSDSQDALFSMQAGENTRDIYWEMVALYKELFVEFRRDIFRGDRLWQISDHGECYVLKNDSPCWRPSEIPDGGTIVVSRGEAEALEDKWAAERSNFVSKRDQLRIEYGERLKKNVYDLHENGSVFLIRDASLAEPKNSPVFHWLCDNGFHAWRYKGWFSAVDWIYVNIRTKTFEMGVPKTGPTGVVGDHAVSFEEFLSIYDIYNKYRGSDVLDMRTK